jgi:hypothetical protein
MCNEMQRVVKLFLLIDVNVFNVYLHDWLNGIFFPLFRHVPPKAGQWEKFFWGMVPFSLVEIDRHFRAAYCLHY